MPPRRGNGSLLSQRVRVTKFRLPVVILLVVSVLTPLVFLAGRLGSFAFYGPKEFWDNSAISREIDVKLNALRQVETFFPREVINAIESNTDDSGILSLNGVRKDLSSSWVVEKPFDAGRKRTASVQVAETHTGGMGVSLDHHSFIPRREALDINGKHGTIQIEGTAKPADKAEVQLLWMGPNGTDEDASGGVSARISRRQLRIERRERQVSELTQQTEDVAGTSEKQAIQLKKEINDSLLHKYSVWRRYNDDGYDVLLRLIRDQLVMARVYSSLAQSQDDADLYQDLNLQIKESRRVLGDANVDSDLPLSASEKVRAMGQILTKARERLYKCKPIAKKLRAMLLSSEEHARALSKESTVLRQILAKTLPRGLHCLSMLLTSEYNLVPEDQRKFPNQQNLEDPGLFHYALFSDNVIATSVVVNSTVVNAKDPEKHVFHLVTDKLNYAAMKMWFLANPPGNATIDVQNIDDFKWLNSSYCPVLYQLQSPVMKEYYFKADHPATLADASSNLKYRNPKYLSMLNHLRFYLPEVYPKLNRILFLDDDIVVQKDLTPLWFIDLQGKVNGAVETCGETFHRFDKYLNFSNPLILANFDPNACGWAYGMNMFDLQQWKKQDITGIYHRWQNLNEGRELWKLGTLPPGLITFYNLTYSLDRMWHLLGLGYDPTIESDEIEQAAVVHFNGNMKPWLDLTMTKYKPYWTKYLSPINDFFQTCNVIL